MARVQWQQPNDLRVDVDRTPLPDPEPGAPALERVGPAVVRAARRGRLGADLQQRLPGDGRAASAGELGPRVVPLRRDGGADGDACPRRGASPAPGGGHAETRGPGARRGPDVDRLGDRGGGPTHLPLPRNRRSGSAPEEGPRGPDSAKARRLNSLANRIVSIDADLEYGLQEGRYWMPYRQVIAGRVRLPVVSDVVIPFQATTTFDDYTINGGRSDRIRRRAARHRRVDPRFAPGSAGDRGRTRCGPSGAGGPARTADSLRVVGLRRPLARRPLRAAPPVQRHARPLR